MAPGATVIFITTVVLSTETFAVLLALIAIHVWYKRSFLSGVVVAGFSLLLSAVVTILKNFFAVARPESALVEVTGYAFPSGHAAGAAFFALVLEWYFRSVLQIKSILLMRVFLVLFVCVVGYTRLYLEVHTLFQVAAGGVVGLLVGLLFQILSRRVA